MSKQKTVIEEWNLIKKDYHDGEVMFDVVEEFVENLMESERKAIELTLERIENSPYNHRENGSILITFPFANTLVTTS